MKPRFNVDPTTFTISRTIGDSTVKYSTSALQTLTARDVLDCEVAIVTDADSVNHTAEIGTSWPKVRLAVRTAVGGDLVAGPAEGTISGTGAAAVAAISLSLNTTKAVELTASGTHTAPVILEAQVVSGTGDTEHQWTLAQQAFTLKGDIITGGEETPEDATAAAGEAATSAATATTQAGIATAQAGIATTQAGIATTQAGISTTKAGEAATSATNAANSATAAANAVAAQFVAVVAGNAVPDTAPASGYHYRISTAGTSHGIDWETTDYAIYTGTSGVYFRLAGPGTSGATTAADVSNTPAGNIAATTVQAAINELDAEKAPVSHAHAASDITSGVFDIGRIPAAALERLVQVANQTARYALTTTEVQLGDTVKELDTGLLYIVKDVANLANANGYQVYTAGSAANVPWSGVTDKPTLGTAAALNVAASGDAASGEVVKGGDSRLHSHTNKTTLDKVTESGGIPLWDGGAWPGGASGSDIFLGADFSLRASRYAWANPDFLTAPATLPAGSAYAVAWSTDGAFLAVGFNGAPNIAIYSRSENTLTKLADPATLPSGAAASLAWSADGAFLAVAHSVSPYVSVYSRSGNTFTKLANPATLPSGTVAYGVAWSADGAFLAVVHDASPYVTVYSRSGNTFTKLADPSTLPAGKGYGVAWSADGAFLAVVHDASPYVTVYSRSGNTFTKLTNPSTLPAGIGRGVAWSADGTFLAVAHDASPYVTVYSRSGNTFTKLTNPSTLPAGNGYGVSWTSDIRFLSVAHIGTPYMAVYKTTAPDAIGIVKVQPLT